MEHPIRVLLEFLLPVKRRLLQIQREHRAPESDFKPAFLSRAEIEVGVPDIVSEPEILRAVRFDIKKPDIHDAVKREVSEILIRGVTADEINPEILLHERDRRNNGNFLLTVLI